jgi:hypothetical protein
MTLVPALRRVRLAHRRLAADAPQRPAAALPAPAAGGLDEKPLLRDWIGVLAMCAGLVMAIMDVQIVTSSLTQIQGGLSASSDEIAWVQTAYLIADTVMVPLSGMMTRLLSTRIVFVVAALGFTGASALCATATSLGQMILYRAIQGFCGGAVTPTVWPVVYAKFRGPPLVTLMVIISMLFNFRDHGSDHRRLSDRHLLLALAVPRQHRARPLGRHRCVAGDRHRQARFLAAARFRRDRTAVDGHLSRLPPIRARGGAALGLAR